MRLLLIFILFCIAGVQFGFCYNKTNAEKENHAISCSEEIQNIVKDRKYICYEFGNTNLMLLIIDGESSCEVYYWDSNSVMSTATIEKTDIIKWALNDMPRELQDAEYIVNEDYPVIWHKLSIINGDTEVIVSSSRNEIVGCKDLVKRINKLKEYLVWLWINKFM